VGFDSAIASLERIAFVDLPTLGGPYVLRGYPRDRFRDRIAAFGTTEYVWEINDFIAGFVFVEPGRVWSGSGDAAPWRMRMGYGGGLQVHTYRSFLARLQLASSIDGGFVANLNLSPGTRMWSHR
jgi:hemolysin activation/secretion protein